MRAHIQTDHQWSADLTAALPAKWRRRLLGRWERARAGGAEPIDAARLANIELRQTVAGLGVVRLPLDASDADVCQRADELAARCFERAAIVPLATAAAVRAAMARVCAAQGIEPPEGQRMTDAGAIARMTCAHWWRRRLRRLHAKNVEGAAIKLGLVNKARQIYVSDESALRRQQQNRRNAAAMEATILENELGQERTVAELAATGTANKAIRRAELMTRIAGFERIARDLGHAGLFFTVTCPSRMHKWRTVAGGGVIENPRYDGTTPREAQGYLAKVWARIRSALKRLGAAIYGFRIAEPNHDGTPHWHLLVFHRAADYEALRSTVLRYALADSPDEPGAHRHRVDFKPIDWSRGSAAGYIAKYVAKNIDGYRVEQDLYGNDALATSARVEAWAATWGIRQFQQIGGAPVGPWRELRRVAAMPAAAPALLQEAWNAVNKVQKIEGRENASVAWDRYTRAQGGVFCGRDYRIRIATRDDGGIGRYGDPIGARPIGVEAEVLEDYTPPHMEWCSGRAVRRVHWLIESVRHAWRIKSRVGRGEGRGSERGAAAPWTRVNNCTREVPNGTRFNAPPPGAPEGRVGECPDDGPRDGRQLHRGPVPAAGLDDRAHRGG